MSNVLIGVIGVILFIGLALAGALFLGERFSNASNDAEAARVISEGAQINRAFELYQLNEGHMPDGSGETGELNERAIDQLVSTGYLKNTPAGAQSGRWHVGSEGGVVLSHIGSGESALAICTAARRQFGLNDEPKTCSDPEISDTDPCCVG